MLNKRLIYFIVLREDRIEDTKGCQNRAIHYARGDNVRFLFFLTAIFSILSVARYARSPFLYINFLYRRPSTYIEEPVYILYSNSLSCIGTLYRIKSFIYSIYTFFWFSLYICVWFSIYKLIYIILLLFFYFFARSLTLAC